jgi:hypothetical protein
MLTLTDLCSLLLLPSNKRFTKNIICLLPTVLLNMLKTIFNDAEQKILTYPC